MVKLSRTVRLYVLAVTAGAGLAAAGWSFAWPNGNGLESYGEAGWLLPVTFAVLSGTAVLFPLTLGPGHKLVINDMVHFASLILFGPLLAMAVVAAGSAVGYGALTIQGKRRVWDIVFNPSKNALAVAAGGVVYYSIIPAHAPASFDDARQMLALPLMAVAMYLVNTVPACVAAGLQHHKHPLQLWMNGRRVDALQTVALFLLGLVTALTVRQYPWAIIVMTLPAALIYVTLKRSADLLDRLQDNHTITAVEAMADTVDLRNPYTHDHGRRVADVALRIARAMALPEPEVEQVRLAARVHNLGNIGVSDQVLRKPGKLTPDEWEQVEKHVRTGYDILGGFADYRECREIVLRHHERWDGSGYPQGLQGVQSAETHRLQMAGQILGVADALDAMTSERPYRAALTLEAALDVIGSEKGRQWHPAVVEAVERTYSAAATTRRSVPAGAAMQTAAGA